MKLIDKLIFDKKVSDRVGKIVLISTSSYIVIRMILGVFFGI